MTVPPSPVILAAVSDVTSAFHCTMACTRPFAFPSFNSAESFFFPGPAAQRIAVARKSATILFIFSFSPAFRRAAIWPRAADYRRVIGLIGGKLYPCAEINPGLSGTSTEVSPRLNGSRAASCGEKAPDVSTIVIQGWTRTFHHREVGAKSDKACPTNSRSGRASGTHF
jgi:hypothetical protein